MSTPADTWASARPYGYTLPIPAMTARVLPGATLSSAHIAALAVRSLKEEVNLTPKPGLVDGRGSGAHTDLTLELMHRSADSLFSCFQEMALAAYHHESLPALRERLGAIGREGEIVMFAVTEGVNTHKGAIWCLGLLTAGFVLCGERVTPRVIAQRAAGLALLPDRHAPALATNGSRVKARYGADGARGEAQRGFPSVIGSSLPMLWRRRREGAPEVNARLDALMALLCVVEDTCVLHRGGPDALATAQRGAAEVLALGGTATAPGRKALGRLDLALRAVNASPGGCGDLLAATLYVDALMRAL